MVLDHDRLRSLEGRNVLVQPEIFNSKNSVGIRGTLHVLPDTTRPEGCRVEIAVGFPEMSDMGGQHGHEERIPIASAELEELLASEYRGAYTYTQRKSDGPTRTSG